MATGNERLMQWLHDAQAMQIQVAEILQALSRHLENYPGVQARTKCVLQETQDQADIIRAAVERGGGDTSILTEVGQPGASEQSLSGAFVGTEATKRSVTQISSYNILIAAVGDSADSAETRAVCADILRQEEAMADWLKKYLASATVEYLGRDASVGFPRKH